MTLHSTNKKSLINDNKVLPQYPTSAKEHIQKANECSILPLSKQGLLGIVLVSLFTVFPVFAEDVPDYNNPYAPIFTDKEVYSWTDKIRITVVAPSWNSDRFSIDSIGEEESHAIKISTSQRSLEPYKLTETDINSGVFTGEIILTGFLHDVNGDGKTDTNPRTLGNGPTGGFLETKRSEGITISFEFADGVVLTKSATIGWNVGEVVFVKSSYTVSDSARIRVTDQDMNLNPEAIDQITIQVSSDSDEAGILVDAIETSEESGVFEVGIFFTQNNPSSGSRLFVSPGDNLKVKYDDYTLPEPYSISDHLQLTGSAKLISELPSTEGVSILDNIITDSSGNINYEPTINEQLQIVGTIKNNQNYPQSFVFLIQIKEEDGTIASLSWVQGEMTPNQILELSQSWRPNKSGNFEVETYVWNSLAESVPLAPPLQKSYFIQ